VNRASPLVRRCGQIVNRVGFEYHHFTGPDRPVRDWTDAILISRVQDVLLEATIDRHDCPRSMIMCGRVEGCGIAGMEHRQAVRSVKNPSFCVIGWWSRDRGRVGHDSLQFCRDAPCRVRESKRRSAELNKLCAVEHFEPPPPPNGLAVQLRPAALTTNAGACRPPPGRYHGPIGTSELLARVVDRTPESPRLQVQALGPPPNKALQRASNSSAELTMVAVRRHTPAAGSGPVSAIAGR